MARCVCLSTAPGTDAVQRRGRFARRRRLARAQCRFLGTTGRSRKDSERRRDALREVQRFGPSAARPRSSAVVPVFDREQKKGGS